MTRLFGAIFISILLSCHSSHKKSKHELLEEKAVYYYNNKTYGEAIDYLDELIGSDSTNGEYYYKRGLCYDGLSNYSHAYFNYEKAIKYKYEVAKSNVNIALIFIQLKQDSIALLYLEKASKAGSTEGKIIQDLTTICNLNIEYQKMEAQKDYQDHKARSVKKDN